MSAEPVSRAGLWTKLRVLFPYFAGTRWAFGLAALGAAFAAVCETGVAWLLVPLVDGGMKAIPIKFLAELPRPPLWAIPVALVVLFALRRTVVQPLRRLVEGIDAVAKRDLSRVILAERDDEIGSIAGRFNAMPPGPLTGCRAPTKIPLLAA